VCSENDFFSPRFLTNFELLSVLPKHRVLLDNQPKEIGMKVLRSGAVVAVALIAALTLSSCGSDSEETMDTAAVETTVGTIVDVASGAGNFSTLVAAVTAAELVETLSGEGPFTVFAPTDEAFAALPAGVLDALLLPENKALLAQILTYHVVSGKVMAADVTDGDVATVEGQTIALSTASGVTVNGANVVSADVPASNGVIHAIDAVILPPGVDVAALTN
jgi:uncharacterized surface protein with fasciclin (FAS1) repeats